MDSKAENYLKNLMAVCQELNGRVVVSFIKGNVGTRDALIMLAGPVLTLDSLQKLRAEIKECLDAKEDQLRGKPDPERKDIYL